MVSIVIESNHPLAMLQTCITSIQLHTAFPYEIIFVDNYINEATYTWLRRVTAAHDNCQVVSSARNDGYAKACNMGIAAAQGEYILLLGSTIRVSAGWLQGLLDCFDGDQNVGIAGPMADNVSGIQQVSGVTLYDVDGLDEYAAHFRETHRYRRMQTRQLDAFCIIFRRDLPDRIGWLDESFITADYSNEDYCIRAAIEGCGNIVAGDIVVQRHVGGSFSGAKNTAANMAADFRSFNDKWSRTVTNPDLGRKIARLKTIENAEEFARRGCNEQAIELLLKEGTGRFPQEPLYYHTLVRLLMASGRTGEALDVLDGTPDPDDDMETVLARGFCLALLGRHAGALDCAETALRVKQDARALCIKGMVAIMTGRKEQGEELLRSATVVDPYRIEAYLALGHYYASTGDERATEYFRQACIVAPSSSLAVGYYYEHIKSQQELELGARLLAGNLSLCPSNRNMHIVYLNMLLRLEKYAEAMGEAEKAVIEFVNDDEFFEIAETIRAILGPATISPQRQASGCSVSLCMIVKNEERFLAKCLASLKPLVDEMIVVDTGSTDRTMAIARIMGAHALEAAWQDDYALARNLSLNHAKGNWILVMDADEVISELDYDAFLGLVHEHKGKMAAFDVVTRNYSNRMDEEWWRPNDGSYRQVEAGGGWRPSGKVRLFTNDQRIRFEGAVHEMVEPSLRRLNIEPIETETIRVHHYGYLDDARQQQKKAKYYQLGIKKLGENCGDPKSICELAIQAAEIGHFQEAIALWERILAIDPDSWLALFNLGSIYLRLGEFEKARSMSRRAMECKENYLEAALNLAFAELCVGAPALSEKIILDFFPHGTSHPPAELMLAIIKCFRGAEDDARKIFSSLRDKNIDFSHLIKEAADKLEMAGHRRQAESLLRIA